MATKLKSRLKKISGTTWFYIVYIFTIIAIYNTRIIDNFTRAFNMLVGKVNYWFVFSLDGTVLPLPSPGTPSDEVPLPVFPDPDIEIPITTWGYWKDVANAIIRGIIIVAIVIAVLAIIMFVLRRLDVRSKRQSTIPYKIYMRTLKEPLNWLVSKLDRLVANFMKIILKKGRILLLLIIALGVNGVLARIIAGLLTSVYSLFLTGPFNWLWLHFKAITYFLVIWISQFTAFNIFITLLIFYNVVAFWFAYKEFHKNELKQEEFVNEMSYGVGLAGGSGKGKTLTGKVLADASHRAVKKYVLEDNKNTEHAYSGLVEFSDVRRYFDKHRDTINDELDAGRLAESFIQEFNIKNGHIDRFHGATPDLYNQLQWYFIGLWITKKETVLLQAPIPVIINDPLTAGEVRNTIFDILTMRREDVKAKVLDQNIIKSSLDNIESELDVNGHRHFRLRRGVKAEDVNLAAHPGLTILWPELDKDFPFNDRSDILEKKVDKILGIFRHFCAFKQKTIGHFIYDSQQRDGVANIIRSKFDSVLKINRQDKGKRSLFLIPYIKYVEKQIRLYSKIKDISVKASPYRKSFFRIFIEWRLRRLTRLNDYFHSFDFIDMHVTLMDSAGLVVDGHGKALKRIRINTANAYFTFPSVVYHEPYKEAKTRFPVKTVKDLPAWESMEMELSDIERIKSEFLSDVFYGSKKKNKRKESTLKSDDELL